eukprot:jgi/Tetstr1/443519/TSEL_031523.t1
MMTLSCARYRDAGRVGLVQAGGTVWCRCAVVCVALQERSRVVVTTAGHLTRGTADDHDTSRLKRVQAGSCRKGLLEAKRHVTPQVDGCRPTAAYMPTDPGDDPWSSRPVLEQLQDLRNEELTPVILEDDEGDGDVSILIEGKIRASVGGFVADLKKGVAICASGCSLTSFPMSSFSRTWIMRLDLSSNKLSVDEVSSLGAGGCWVRDLSVANNNLSEFPSLTANFPRLLRLDLSDNDFDSLQGLADSTPPALVDLDISGCALTGLMDEAGDTCPLAAFTALSTLNLGANDIEDFEELAPLATLRSVRHLSLEDNPCTEEHRCKAYIRKKMPWLARLDNDNLKQGINVQAGPAATSDNIDTILEFNKDRSSCSCLEGNACTAPEGCTDWKNRYAVARAVRQRTGFRAGGA